MFPILFKIGGYPFHTYGFLLGWSCFFAANLMVWLAEKDGISSKVGWRFAVSSIAAGFVGSHLHARLTDPGVASVNQGFTFYGAALSGTLAAIPISFVLKESFWKFADATAPALALAHALGRLGCFFSGCCFGKCAPEGSSFGVAFPGPDSFAFKHHLEAGLIPPYATHSLPVYPTQLIESAWDGVVAVLLTLWVIRGPRRTGSALLVYYLLYGPLRIGVEMLRDDPGRGELFGVSTSTGIGIITTVIALVLLLPPLAKLRPLRDRKPAAATQPESAETKA